MTTAQLVFLYTAEELNISRAAKRAFVSQQCASTHIKKLEAAYGLPLFNRKPALSLTEAGRMLYASCRQMQLLEQSTDSMISEIRAGSAGLIRLGMNSARSRLLIPSVIKEYRMKYPEVQVDIRFGDTHSLIRQLKAGELDFVTGIGITPEELSSLNITPISQDAVFFLASRPLLKKYAPGLLLQANPENGERVLSLRDLAAFPMCRNNRGSTLTTLIDQKTAQEGILLKDLYFVSDYDIQLSLCAEGLAGCFCPSMMLRRAAEINTGLKKEERILDFRIAEIKDTLSIDLIRLKYSFQPHYMEAFSDCFRRAFL